MCRRRLAAASSCASVNACWAGGIAMERDWVVISPEGCVPAMGSSQTVCQAEVHPNRDWYPSAARRLPGTLGESGGIATAIERSLAGGGPAGRWRQRARRTCDPLADGVAAEADELSRLDGGESGGGVPRTVAAERACTRCRPVLQLVVESGLPRPSSIFSLLLLALPITIKYIASRTRCGRRVLVRGACSGYGEIYMMRRLIGTVLSACAAAVGVGGEG